METLSFHLYIENVSLSFWEKGEGENILLCTHGYRQDKAQFPPLFETIPEGWKILAFDQPMHGNTHWDDKNYCFDKFFFKKLWKALMEKYPQKQWSLLGFSMGGKTAMMMHQAEPLLVRKMILIAPGGVYTTPLNRFFSYHRLGRPFFQYLLKNPNTVMKGISYAHKKKWMRPFQYRFLKAHFTNLETSLFLRRFVSIYRNFDFPFPAYARFTQTTNTHLYLLWGKQDEVVTVNQTDLFRKYAPQTRITVIEGRHNLIEENLEEVRQYVEEILGNNSL